MNWKFLVVFSICILFISTFNESYQGSVSVPEKPTGVFADDVGPNQIDISWNAPDDGGSPITGYRIEYRNLNDPGNYIVLESNTESSSTVYSHTDAITDNDYVYRIAAINAQGQSKFSAESNIATPTSSSTPPESIAPNPPTNLVAEDIAPKEIELTWTKPTANNGPAVTGYKIEYKSGSGTFQTVVSNTQSGTTKYTHTGLTTGTTYTYRVYAINSIGTSSASNEDSATPTSSSSPEVENKVPNSPSGLKVSPVSPTSLKISWNEPSGNGGPPVTGYKIEFKRGSDEFEVLSENIGNVRSYKHTGLTEGSTYTYRVYAINSVGTSGPSSSVSGEPGHTQAPTDFTAIATSPTKILLSWEAPSQTYGMSIGGYIIKEQISPGVYSEVANTNGPDTSYTVTGLTTGETYTYVVAARLTVGSSPDSETASATPTASSKPPSTDTIPGKVTGLNAKATSPVQIDLTWNAPSNNGGSPITGYKIDVKVGTGSYTTLVQDTDSTVRAYSHTGRTTDTTYTYRVSAINAVGVGAPSDESSATPTATSQPEKPDTKPNRPIGLKATPFSQTQINLSWSPPSDDGGQPVTGYKIEYKEGNGQYRLLTPNTGKSTTYSHTGLSSGTTYTYRVYAINSIGTSSASIEASATPLVPEQPDEKPKVPDFVDPDKGAQHYLDRYYNEVSYREWFDSNFPDYTIEEAIELAIPGSIPDEDDKGRVPDFVDPEKGAQHYLDRYQNEPAYREWFDKNFPDYTIEEAIELAIPDAFEEEPLPQGICGEGTKWVDGKCILDENGGGGCLIATATYGSEMSPQVQKLRELRDRDIMSTSTGSTFMKGFNQIYYSFSPVVADFERQNPVFKEMVKIGITPMMTSLSILEYTDLSSDQAVLGYGIGIILLNIGMYFVGPIFACWWIKNRFSDSK